MSLLVQSLLLGNLLLGNLFLNLSIIVLQISLKILMVTDLFSKIRYNCWKDFFPLSILPVTLICCIFTFVGLPLRIVLEAMGLFYTAILGIALAVFLFSRYLSQQ